MSNESSDITELLASTEPDAMERALPHLYQELSVVASSYLARERADHTLQTGDLIHEVYMRLQGRKQMDWQSRKHFLVVAANAMRRYLIDYARQHGAKKRQRPDRGTITLPALDEKEFDVMDLESALTKLEALDDDMATIVKLRFFAGLPAREIAPVLGLSDMAVARRWWQARQWLKRELAA